ncbi:hypothetical protein M413DRAFT_446485 [Hebeloma cylindrosporum]|uniref:Uncharacterized protein n=1 Tax=Hebeloma cylindrosporum TaxID=76867 RepID=A0A0C2YGT6_HEBCY|nr:hypothetical protein M413DRAFT_446485 [Hebeloma cylindrosporum h7]
MAQTALSNALQSNDLNRLIQLVKDHPSWDTVYDISVALKCLSFEDPSKIDDYTTTLTALQKSPEVPKIRYDWNGSDAIDAFYPLFNRQIYNVITAVWGDRKVRAITPTNDYLVASILSGCAIRSGLCVSSAQIGEVTQGLQFPESEYQMHYKRKHYEVNAVGACIQVLAAGQAILKTDMLYESEFTERILTIGQAVKSPVGKIIVEAAQKQAEGKFNKPLSSKEIVSLLQSNEA